MGAVSAILPLWQCHNQVRAAQIREIGRLLEDDDVGEAYWVHRLFFDEGHIDVDSEWIERHRPKIGGYVVQDADGHTSYSPQAAFESGHTRL